MRARTPPILLASILLGVLGCSGGDELDLPDPGERLIQPACEEGAGPFAPLSNRCQHFVDGEGRVVVLHGVNARVEGIFDVTFDDGRTALEPIPAFDADDANRMRELGINLLRLPVNWSGIEPEDTAPPTYDAEYLDRIQRVVDLCRDAGVLVLIDFHQDAYSKHIGEDGAPLWAIEPPPDMLLEGPLTDLEQRRLSTQVIEAFNTFWGDADPGPALRARFASMAAAVAQRFAGDRAVLGFEVFNEPVFGTQEQIMAFNVQVAEAIRAASPGHLIAFEPETSQRTITDMNVVPDAPFPLDGAVYAPHVYTLAFTPSDPRRQTFTRETLTHGNRTAYEEAKGFGTPLLIGEWGYDPGADRARDYLELQLDLHAEHGASDAFWVWKERSQGRWGMFDYDDATGTWTERPLVRGALSRPMPERIAGWPRWWRYDRDALRLELVYDGDGEITAPTQVYVPGPEDFAADYEVHCDGSPVDASRDPATGLVEVPCAGEGPHAVVVQAL